MPIQEGLSRRAGDARRAKRDSLHRTPWSILPQLALLFACAATPVVAIAGHGDVESQKVPFQIERNAGNGSARSAARPVALRFEAFGRRFDLDLERNDALVAPWVQAYLIGDGGRESVSLPVPWIGRGKDGSESRLTISGDQAKGFVRTSSGTYVFETTAPDHSTGASLSVRRAADMLDAATQLSCESDVATVSGAIANLATASGVGANLATAALTTMGAASTAQPHILELSLVADAAFYRNHGDQSVQDMLTLINGVDGIFRNDLGVAIQLVQVVAYRTEASQPFSSTATAEELLSAVALARTNDPLLSVGEGGITHLMTGRDLGRTGGIAWIGGVCHPNSGASLSTVDTTSSYLATVPMAHEMGHNLGAIHDGTNATSCESTPLGYVMWPVLFGGVSEQFSPCSKDSVEALLPFRSCLSSQVPDLCGNGVIDAGEDCDAGGAALDSCCRIDCTHAAAGLPCGDTGDACFDAVCDGAGTCGSIANDASCPSADACLLARCSDGTCLPSGEDRPLDEVETRFHIDAAGTIVSAKISASATIGVVASNPCDTGMEVRVTVGESTLWDETIPAGNWLCKNSTNFSYRAIQTLPGHVRSVRVKYDAAGNVAVFRMKLASPSVPVAPAPPTVFLLAGDRIDGQCGTNTLSDCSLYGATYRCQ